MIDKAQMRVNCRFIAYDLNRILFYTKVHKADPKALPTGLEDMRKEIEGLESFYCNKPAEALYSSKTPIGYFYRCAEAYNQDWEKTFTLLKKSKGNLTEKDAIECMGAKVEIPSEIQTTIDSVYEKIKNSQFDHITPDEILSAQSKLKDAFEIVSSRFA